MLDSGLRRAKDSGAHCPGSTGITQGTCPCTGQQYGIMRQLLALVATAAQAELSNTSSGTLKAPKCHAAGTALRHQSSTTPSCVANMGSVQMQRLLQSGRRSAARRPPLERRSTLVTCCRDSSTRPAYSKNNYVRGCRSRVPVRAQAASLLPSSAGTQKHPCDLQQGRLSKSCRHTLQAIM